MQDFCGVFVFYVFGYYVEFELVCQMDDGWYDYLIGFIFGQVVDEGVVDFYDVGWNVFEVGQVVEVVVEIIDGDLYVQFMNGLYVLVYYFGIVGYGVFGEFDFDQVWWYCMLFQL